MDKQRFGRIAGTAGGFERTVAALTTAVVIAVATAPAGAAEPPEAGAQFVWLQSLEGDWVLAAEQQGEASRHPVIAPLVGSGKVALSYRLVGSKTTLQENIFPGTPREMATMYHCADKRCSEVVADHYCSLKNQPVLRAEAAPEAGMLRFRCDPSVAVCASADAHLHALTIERIDGQPDRLKTTFALQKNGQPGETLVFQFERRQ